VAGDGGLDNTIEAIRVRYDLPSVAALLLHEGQVVEVAAVGLRAAGSPARVTAADRWHLGSLTKAMTATLAAVLVERGVVSWGTTVGDAFPDLVGTIDPSYEDAALEELLSHTAGLPLDVTRASSWRSLRDDPAPITEQRRRWAAELLRTSPDAPRGAYLYTNAGYIVAGAMLEKITGEPWEVLIRREVFAPLGMYATGFGAPGTAGSIDEPRGHAGQDGGWLAVEPGPDADMPAAIGPAGTVHSTLGDYARYMAAHLAGARGYGGLISAASFSKLHTPAPGTEYALGWGIVERDWAKGRVLMHHGSNGLWFATVWIAPERDLAMLAVTNAGGSGAAGGVREAIRALRARVNAAMAQGWAAGRPQ
jgi:CubicO group peptidase (beta-lactamase class C family)